MFLLDHLSLVVSASERNKMSAQALATVMGPPLMLHSANTPSGTEVDHAQPIAVLKYLLQIWPQPQSAIISGNVTNINRFSSRSWIVHIVKFVTTRKHKTNIKKKLLFLSRLFIEITQTPLCKA